MSIMATFIEERKKQKKLLYILLAVLVITTFILWYGFFRQPEQITEIVKDSAFKFRRTVEINFSLLENPLLTELKQFEGIKPLEQGIGRENPLIPY
jgi:hypothetical protein